MDVYAERRIDELEKQLLAASTQEEVELVEKKLNALRQLEQ